MRHSSLAILSLASLVSIAVSGCDTDGADDPIGGKADDVASESAKSYTGRDFYDIDRFDDNNDGRVCGFERARRGSLTSATHTISLNSVTFPLSTVRATDDRPIRLERKDPESSLFERPMFVGTVTDDTTSDFTITLFINRLSLDPDVMLISHASGNVQLCQGLEPDDG